MTKKVENIVFSTTYQGVDKATGEVKEMYKNTNIGTIFTNEKGHKSMKIDFIPTDLNSGFLNVFEQKTKS